MKGFKNVAKISFRFLLFLVPALASLAGCISYSSVLSPDKVKEVNTVAVVLYSVPEKIIYREGIVAASNWAGNRSSKGSGEEAATKGYKAFVKELQAKAPFKMLDADSVLNNAQVKQATKIVLNAYKEWLAILGLNKKTPRVRPLRGYKPYSKSPKGLPSFGYGSYWPKKTYTPLQKQKFI